ncbi:hypothetical protein Pelo_10154 [Pelomyxa schiedti]|nr:hypothetical protein Pelo_10154 [Pelomyxa schiedti]
MMKTPRGFVVELSPESKAFCASDFRAELGTMLFPEWNPANHSLFPHEFKSIVRTIVLCRHSCAHSGTSVGCDLGNILAALPLEFTTGIIFWIARTLQPVEVALVTSTRNFSRDHKKDEMDDLVLQLATHPVHPYSCHVIFCFDLMTMGGIQSSRSSSLSNL